MSRIRLTASVTERLDRVATELEQAGRPDMALALDQVSDHLEQRKALRAFLTPDTSPKKLLDVAKVMETIKRHSNTKSAREYKKVPGLFTRLSVELKNGYNLSVIVSQDSDESDPELLDVGILDQNKHLLELPKSTEFKDGTGKIEFRELNSFLDWIRNDLIKEINRKD